MPPSLTELFRTLTSFSPARADLKGAPWEDFVDWAIAQGLGPLAAYNLEYRLPGARVPDWVRDRLLSVFQGSVNDNVMKLVNFKRAVEELEGRQVLLLGGAAFAEALYPHVAFRPIVDLTLLVPRGEVDAFANFLRRADFRGGPTEGPTAGPTAVGPAAEGSSNAPAGVGRVLSDGRTAIFLYGELTSDAAEDAALFARSQPVKVLGPSIRRLELEDALLVQAVLIARAGFDVPMIEFVDLRELVLGAPSVSGPYSRAPDAASLLARAATWKAERPLWTALSIVARLFPETAQAVAALSPPLSFPVRELLDRVVVSRVAEPGRTEAFRGEDTLRQLLTGA